LANTSIKTKRFPISDFLFSNREAATRKFCDRNDASDSGDGASGPTCSMSFQRERGLANDVIGFERFDDAECGTIRSHEIAQKWECRPGKYLIETS
jgi:hypothetical protein